MVYLAHATQVNSVDVNQYLYPNQRRGGLKAFLAEGYRIIVIAWNFEIVLLHHLENKEVVLLQQPLSKAGDSREKIPLERIIMRNLVVQLLKKIFTSALMGVNLRARNICLTSLT